ncbi:hypothetical protein HK101_001492 [Irineochytrium annulatum]|nr:hypothetical protein HK101_001492 [Irineochytrium annulatum]
MRFAGIACESNSTEYCAVQTSAANDICKGLPHCRGFACWDPPTDANNACFIFMDGMQFAASLDLLQSGFLQNGLSFSQTGISGTPVIPVSSSTSRATTSIRTSSKQPTLTSPQPTPNTTSTSLPVSTSTTSSSVSSTTIAVIVTCVVLVLLLLLGVALFLLHLRRRRISEKAAFDPSHAALPHSPPPSTLPPVVVHTSASQAYHNTQPRYAPERESFLLHHASDMVVVAPPRTVTLTGSSAAASGGGWDMRPPEPEALEREVRELREQLGQMRSLVATTTSAGGGSSSGSGSGGPGDSITIMGDDGKEGKGRGLLDPKDAVAVSPREVERVGGNASLPRYSDHGIVGSGEAGATRGMSVRDQKL